MQKQQLQKRGIYNVELPLALRTYYPATKTSTDGPFEILTDDLSLGLLLSSFFMLLTLHKACKCTNHHPPLSWSQLRDALS
jgi:hypothetical protein